MRRRSMALVLATMAVTLGSSDAVMSQDAVRSCRYIPGVSIPASMPADLDAGPTSTPRIAPKPAPTGQADPRTVKRQQRIMGALVAAIGDHYVYPDHLDDAWRARVDAARARIADGLDPAAFGSFLGTLVASLGDEHSYLQTPDQVRDEAAAIAGQQDFVGIGALFLPIVGTDTAAIMTVFPDSPAAEAGLLPHDVLLSVDGGPVRDQAGISRTRGRAGTSVTLSVRRPGAVARDVTVVRREVTGALPIDVCRVIGTHIGYLFLPTVLAETIDDQVRHALIDLTADGPLDGLVIADRVNGGGLGSVAEAILGMFAAGHQGAWVSRERSTVPDLDGEDIGGSQTVPIVVPVGPDTVSYGEILAGVLRTAGRATIVGMPSLGNVEQLHRFDLPDGWRAWLASAAFRPTGQTTGVWERTGIVPDVLVPMRWDLFTEATDPALARAVELLRED